jgi:hypothetical protein
MATKTSKKTAGRPPSRARADGLEAVPRWMLSLAFGRRLR